MTCAEVAAWRAEVAANPWHCKGETRSGYHCFPAEPQPSDVCGYKGCGMTMAELFR